MITIVTERPVRSIDVFGYGVDSYIDKSGKKIYRVYGIVKCGVRGRLVTRDNQEVKDLYTDDTTVVIYRSEDKNNALACKDMIDHHVASGAPAFSVEGFKNWLSNPMPPNPMPPENPDPTPKMEGEKN